MTGSAHAQPSRIAVVGLCASVGLWAGLDVTNAATATQALLAGLMLVVVTAVLDSSARAERRVRLRDLLDATDWLPGAVATLAGATREIVERHPTPEIATETRRRFERLGEDLAELARGRIVRPGADHELLMSGTEACHRTMLAVSDVVAGPTGLRWWQSGAGLRYWEANLDALSRGVAITRVFVCAALSPELATMITGQRLAGVRALVALRDPADPTPHGDLVVWDSRRAWEGLCDAHGERITNIFTVNEQDLQRLTDEFTGWAAAARVVDS